MKNVQKNQTAPALYVKPSIDDFNLDMAFVQAVADVLGAVDHGDLADNTVTALMSEVASKLQEMQDFTEALHRYGGPKQ